MKPMGGRTWKYWPASGPVFILSLKDKLLFYFIQNIFELYKLPLNDGFGFFKMGINYKVKKNMFTV